MDHIDVPLHLCGLFSADDPRETGENDAAPNAHGPYITRAFGAIFCDFDHPSFDDISFCFPETSHQ